jgi:glycosyltransferase involved in cell wall biosynthesis
MLQTTSNRTKVLLIDFSGYGVMTHVLSFLDKADRSKWDYSVLYATDDLRPGVDTYCSELAKRNIPSMTIPVRQGLEASDVVALIKTVKAIRRLRPALIHCHSSKAGAIGRTAAMICNVPSLFTPHSFSFQLALNGSRKRRILTFIERQLGRITHDVAAVSETERDLAVNEGIAPAEKVHLIPNGVDIDKCEEAASHNAATRASLGIAPDEPVVCYVGRLAPQKMPHIVVEAAHAMIEKYGKSPLFLMVGNGPLEGEIDALIATKNLSSRVRRLGWLPHNETLRILSCADVMVLPSRYEGLPYVALEAQAVRTVPILTCVPGSQDTVIDDITGIFVPLDDPQALAAQIQRVITDKDLKARLEDGGILHIEKNYSSCVMARRIETMYRKALEEPSTVPSRLEMKKTPNL